jgi:two-component system sensor histidine kinase/response regulator
MGPTSPILRDAVGTGYSLRMETSARPTVVVIDDEGQTVAAVKHLLRRSYEVFGATSAAEGLLLLAKHDVAVVLCDQRMPTMDGTTFFSHAQASHPDTVRVLMTAYTDVGELIESVNRGHIFGYLAKPWQPEALEHTIATAVNHWSLLAHNREVTLALAAKNVELARTNRELRAFTHVVAHDLKEPLRTISAYVRLLGKDFGDQIAGEPERYLGAIDRCAGHLHQLISDLLQFSEFENAEFDLEDVNLDDTLARARELLTAPLADRGAELRVSDSLPSVRGDAMRLPLLFMNLIGNGIKFNRSEKPVVEVTAAAAPEPGVVRVSVRDNGIGIQPEHHDRIFKLFERLHGRHEFPGTGAGLAIVKSIVDGHIGRIEVSSTAEGTTFHIYLHEATGA